MVDLEALEALGQRAAAGDEAALEQVLVDCRPLVLARCGRFLPNRLDAEEACQDTLLAVHRNITTFAGRSKFTTWLYRVTTNSSIDCYRKLKRRQSVLIDSPHEPVAPGSTPSVVAGSRIDVLEAAEQIDPKFMEPALMRDLCDLDYAEIASILEIPEGTVKSRVHEARGRMRHIING